MTGCPAFWTAANIDAGLNQMTQARPPFDLLRPYAPESMRCWPVNQRVGNVRNDDQRLIEPLSPAPAPSPKLSLFPE
jgi:putative SOS response-associated peptidase YedK